MDEGVYTLQIKCRLPATDLFLRCPPSAPKEPRRTRPGPNQPAIRTEELRTETCNGHFSVQHALPDVCGPRGR